MSTLTQTAPAITRTRGAHRAPSATAGLGRTVSAAARTLARLLANLMLVAAVLALFGLALGPRFLPYRTTTMLTGSMAPLIEPGDVAVVTAEPVQDVTVGQILQIQAPTADHSVYTHRVIEVEHHADGSVWIRTKGDANQGADPWLAKLEGPAAYQVRFVVPHLGQAIRALRQPAVEKTLIFGIPGVLAIWVLAGIWRKNEEDQ